MAPITAPMVSHEAFGAGYDLVESDMEGTIDHQNMECHAFFFEAQPWTPAICRRVNSSPLPALQTLIAGIRNH